MPASEAEGPGGTQAANDQGASSEEILILYRVIALKALPGLRRAGLFYLIQPTVLQLRTHRIGVYIHNKHGVPHSNEDGAGDAKWLLFNAK
ncbi:hypothetical protein PCCS19_25270 [Paenibacillus sp. CCS19]|nr:hypothetical protein PCCS19_25270 [Paenibacillus cellulosilyticus]